MRCPFSSVHDVLLEFNGSHFCMIMSFLRTAEKHIHNNVFPISQIGRARVWEDVLYERSTPLASRKKEFLEEEVFWNRRNYASSSSMVCSSSLLHCMWLSGGTSRTVHAPLTDTNVRVRVCSMWAVGGREGGKAETICLKATTLRTNSANWFQLLD